LWTFLLVPTQALYGEVGSAAWATSAGQKTAAHAVIPVRAVATRIFFFLFFEAGSAEAWFTAIALPEFGFYYLLLGGKASRRPHMEARRVPNFSCWCDAYCM
jgi:hypothetical protein